MTSPTRNYVTVVSGAPRSGTSMMMRMLEAGGMAPVTDHARTADVDNPNGYYEFEAVKQTRVDASWLDDAGGHAVKMVYALLRDLPVDRGYRVVMMRRDLREVVRSQNKMLERLGKPRRGISDERVVEMFEKHLDQIGQWLARYPGFQVLDVDYNALLVEPRPHLERVAEFLDGLDVDAMAAVVDPSLYRNRS